MTQGPALRVTRLIEVVPLTPGTTTDRLRSFLTSTGDSRLALLPLDDSPGLLVRTTDLDAAGLLRILPADEPVQVSELHARAEVTDPPASLSSLVTAARLERRIAVGRAAVERAVQRRRVDIVIVAADADADYARSLELILASAAPGIQVITAPDPARDLGTLAGVKRAGVIGITRGGTALRIPGQARQCHGRSVSSVPGSPSSALTRLNGQ
jgi:ribosomal protein L7Ae-like RNA K-turn-binding protein